MNTVPARLTSNGSSLAVTIGQTNLPLPPQSPAAHAYVGREVILGIRPECISDAIRRADVPDVRIDAEVEVVEPTGAETLVLVRVADQRLRARVAPDVRLSPGQRATFSVDTRTACLFDPQTERLIA
jgi:multiple sugar transport system ATP-binding protein